MEVVEQQLREGTYGGLKAREARLKERHDARISDKEADEIRRLAQLKLAEKEAQETSAGVRKAATSAEVETPKHLRRELDELAQSLPQTACLSVVGSTAQITIEETPYRKLTAKLQFPEDYPETAVTVHAQSATLAQGLLERLEASANSAVAAKRGKPHAAVATDLLVKFVASNCLATAYTDLAQLRGFFAGSSSRLGFARSFITLSPHEKSSPCSGDVADATPGTGADAARGLKPRSSVNSDSAKIGTGSARSSSDCGSINCSLEHAKQSTGEVAMMLRAGTYFMHVRTLVPKGYPAGPLSIEVTDSNLPDALVRLEAAKVADMARKMAAYQAPEGDAQAAQARAGAGEAATSKAERLAREGKQTVVSFNKGQHLAQAAAERNQATQERREAEARAFVAQPSLFLCIEHLCTKFLFPLATGHCPVCSKRLLPSDSKKLGKVPADMQVLKIYCGHHYHFACVDQYLSEPPFGKTCHACGVPIEHRALTTDVKVLEARWASKQAKQRELDEIADFLS